MNDPVGLVTVPRVALQAVLGMYAVEMHHPCTHTVEQRGERHGYDCGVGESVAALHRALAEQPCDCDRCWHLTAPQKPSYAREDDHA